MLTSITPSQFDGSDSATVAVTGETAAFEIRTSGEVGKAPKSFFTDSSLEISTPPNTVTLQDGTSSLIPLFVLSRGSVLLAASMTSDAPASAKL